KIIAASDVYCQPNIDPEPFGITFIEALYAGKPVVGTSVGGPTEIIDDSCGFLVPPNDALALANILRRLIGNQELRTQLGAHGPLRAQGLCDPAMQMKNLHGTLARVTSDGLS